MTSSRPTTTALTLLRIDASNRVDGSVSRRLADAVEQRWRLQHPTGTVMRRDVGLAPFPPVWHAGVTGTYVPADQRTDEQKEAFAVSAELVAELLAADAIVLAVPIYNWGVPQGLKQWIDLISLDARSVTSDGTFLAGRQAIVVEARGAGYSAGTPREGWDHVTPYLTTVLGDSWGLKLSFARAELTSAEVNPAMAFLRDEARKQLEAAESTAATHTDDVMARLRAIA